MYNAKDLEMTLNFSETLGKHLNPLAICLITSPQLILDQKLYLKSNKMYFFLDENELYFVNIETMINDNAHCYVTIYSKLHLIIQSSLTGCDIRINEQRNVVNTCKARRRKLVSP